MRERGREGSGEKQSIVIGGKAAGLRQVGAHRKHTVLTMSTLSVGLE